MTELYKIEKGVPLPSAIYQSRHWRNILETMETSDSFVMPLESRRNFVSFACTLRPKRFTTRTVTENGEKVVRVWRIE